MYESINLSLNLNEINLFNFICSFYLFHSFYFILFTFTLYAGSLLIACAFLGAEVVGSDVDGDCLGLAPTDLPLKVSEGGRVSGSGGDNY